MKSLAEVVNSWWYWWEDRHYWKTQRMFRNLRVPEHLAKATEDQFIYACGLTDGTILFFESAKVHKCGWVTLEWHHSDMMIRSGHFSSRKETPPCPRGMQVRLEAIIWVADAPEGS